MGLGMEIWRVPNDWVHPKNEAGGYIPLCEQDFDKVANQWMSDMSLWEGEKRFSQNSSFYWETVAPPKREHYLPFLTQALTSYQLYDDQGKGLPVSPVFKRVEDLKQWLIWQGRSKVFVEAFAKYGFAAHAKTSYETGYFRVTDDYWVDDRHYVSFTINGIVSAGDISP